MRRLLLLLTLWTLGCGSDAGGGFIKADIYDVDQGTTTTINAEAMLVRQGEIWALSPPAASAGYTLSLGWVASKVTAPGEYPNTLTIAGLTVTRPHPTESGKVRLSTTSGGKVIFNRLETNSGGEISGTFDGMDLKKDTTEEKFHIQIKNGSFAGYP